MTRRILPAATLAAACLFTLGARAADAEALLAAYKDLGAPEPERRKTAQEEVKRAGLDALPVLLAMLHPKQETDEVTRIGVLRALASLAPLTEQAAQTLAWTAVYDAFPEVRREACVTIRQIQDDRAIREVLKYGLAQDPAVRRSAALALREIDDPRALAALVRAIPGPSVTANVALPNQYVDSGLMLPIGPAGARMPIYLPRTEVSGVATDIGSPVTDLLKLIAGKDFGNLPFAWVNWFREKLGEIGTAERDAYRDHRSARDRMNLP